MASASEAVAVLIERLRAMGSDWTADQRRHATLQPLRDALCLDCCRLLADENDRCHCTNDE